MQCLVTNNKQLWQLNKGFGCSHDHTHSTPANWSIPAPAKRSATCYYNHTPKCQTVQGGDRRTERGTEGGTEGGREGGWEGVREGGRDAERDRGRERETDKERDRLRERQTASLKDMDNITTFKKLLCKQEYAELLKEPF